MSKDLYTATSKNFKNLYTFGKQFMLKNVEYKGFYNIQANGNVYTGKVYTRGKSKKLEIFAQSEESVNEYKKLKPKLKTLTISKELQNSADDQAISRDILLDQLIIVPPDINDSAI